MEQNKGVMLKIEDLHVSYGQIQAVRGVSLEVKEGEFVTLIGSNGAGKSTLLNAILGVQPSSGGTITFMGKDITSSSTEKIVASGISVVPEGRGVLQDMTVLENLQLGAYHKKGDITPDLEKIYERFPVLAERRLQKSGTLSGGEQQMLAIGRALMASPKLLLLDELSLALAPVMVDAVFKTLHDLRKDNITILLSEQNARKALQYSDRGYVLELGKISLTGMSHELCDHPGVCDAYLG